MARSGQRQTIDGNEWACLDIDDIRAGFCACALRDGCCHRINTLQGVSATSKVASKSKLDSLDLSSPRYGFFVGPVHSTRAFDSKAGPAYGGRSGEHGHERRSNAMLGRSRLVNEWRVTDNVWSFEGSGGCGPTSGSIQSIALIDAA